MKKGGRRKGGRNRSLTSLIENFLEALREDILEKKGRERTLTFVKSRPRALLFEKREIHISGRKNQQLIKEMLEEYLIEEHEGKYSLTFFGFLKLLCLKPPPESDIIRALATGTGVLQGEELEKGVENYNSWIRKVKELVKTAAKHFQHPLFEKCELFENDNPSYPPPGLEKPKPLSRIYYVYYDAAKKLLDDETFLRNIERIKFLKKERQRLFEKRREFEDFKKQRGRKGRWKRASFRRLLKGALYEETTLKDYVASKIMEFDEKNKFQKKVIESFERGLLHGYASKFLSLCGEQDIVMPRDQDLYDVLKNIVQVERVTLEKQLENLQRIEHLVEEAKP
jgi:hypothetical protein